VARCGCAGQTCSCVLVEGDNVTITGSGSAGSPFVISADGGGGGDPVTVSVTDTPTLDLTLTGAGHPYVLSGVVKLDPDAGNLLTSTSGLLITCADILACIDDVDGGSP
jgi:hypothetical protein